ncbi:MAG: FecR domain-containing protein [Proteobacteria bacterium]|nr:FecR domain-containing protein [Pseudomonadota bacterium]
MVGNAHSEFEPGSARTIERAAADWLARRDGVGWGEADEAALEQWLGADFAHRVAFLRLHAAWEQSDRLRALGAGWQGAGPPPRGHWREPPLDRHERMLQTLPARVRPRLLPRRRLAGLAAATAALAASALLALWIGHRPVAPVAAVRYDTALGQVRTVALADGSQATLDSDSRIEVRLRAGERDITLSRGEAIFAVVKDHRRPFVVTVDGYRVVAVGTRFSVRRDAADLQVAVTEGTVRLESPSTRGDAQPSALLPAGSVAQVRADGVLVRSLPLAQVEQMLDWREGMLAFHDIPLAQAVAAFNRYNARKLVLADPAAGELHVSGNFRWDNEDGFARLLQAGFPIRVEYAPGRIVLHAR